MNSSFANYSTSFYELLESKIPSVEANDLDILGYNEGKIVPTGMFYLNTPTDTGLYTDKIGLNIGDKDTGNFLFKQINIGFWINPTPGYPDFQLNMYPTSIFHNGIDFRPNPTRYNDAILWMNPSNVLLYRDKPVCSGDGILDHIPIFDNGSGVLKDSGAVYAVGEINPILNGGTTIVGNQLMPLTIKYQVIGKKITLVVEKFLFEGSLSTYGSSAKFFYSDAPGSFLPPNLRPLSEAAVPITIFCQDSGAQGILDAPGMFKVSEDGEIVIARSPSSVLNGSLGTAFDADAGAYDGWATFSITYELP